MLKREDTKKLAELSRIEIEDNELDSITGEIDSILGYVKSIQGFHTDKALPEVDAEEVLKVGTTYNVLREDENPTEPGTYSKDIIAEFPEREDNYLKVKKIL